MIRDAGGLNQLARLVSDAAAAEPWATTWAKTAKNRKYFLRNGEICRLAQGVDSKDTAKVLMLVPTLKFELTARAQEPLANLVRLAHAGIVEKIISVAHGATAHTKNSGTSALVRVVITFGMFARCAFIKSAALLTGEAGVGWHFPRADRTVLFVVQNLRANCQAA